MTSYVFLNVTSGKSKPLLFKKHFNQVKSKKDNLKTKPS